jgi:hypothetical protein
MRVSTILLDPLRILCSEIGLHEGDIIACRSVTPSLLLLETPAGHTIALLRERARFVRVVDPGITAFTAQSAEVSRRH